MAVTTAIQIGADVGAEIQARQRTNNFLDKINEELFKPAGLYAMVVKYKSGTDVEDSLLSRFGVSSEKVDFNTNQTIAKYNHTLSNDSSRSTSERMQNLRLASGTTKGAMHLPEAAPLVFPDVDQAIVKDGPETFKDRTKDAKEFLGDYLDRRAQVEYVSLATFHLSLPLNLAKHTNGNFLQKRDDPTSTLALPESQRQFKSSLADPYHPMFQGGLAGLASGGALTKYRDRGRPLKARRHERRARTAEMYDRGMDGPRPEYGYSEDPGYGGRGRGGGRPAYRQRFRSSDGRRRGLIGGLIGVAASAASGSRAGGAGYGGQAPRAIPADRSLDGRSKEYEGSYNGHSDARHADPGAMSGSFGSRDAAGAYGYRDSANAPQYGGRQRYPRKGRAGAVGMVKRVMREDVMYLMIVNIPSEAELAEAREALGRA